MCKIGFVFLKSEVYFRWQPRFTSWVRFIKCLKLKTRRSLRTKPVALAFTRCEPSEGAKANSAPLILHHGFTSSKERWKPIQQTLADKSKRVVYAVDARNHGESERSDFFNFDILSEDLEHFMDTNSIPKASFIGHSMGGIAVMSLALKVPEKVEKIIVEDVSPKEPEPELYFVFQAMVAELIKCFEQSSKSDTEGTMHQKLRECIYRTVPMIPDEDREVIQSMKFPMKKTENGFVSLTNLTVLLKAVKNPPICHFSQNNAFNGDALFIYGGQSNFCILDDKEIILKHFPKAVFCCFENAGHEVCARYPERFLSEVLKFL